MIIGNEARWQRTFKGKNQISIVQDMWKTFDTSTTKSTPGVLHPSNEMNTSFYIKLPKLTNFTCLMLEMNMVYKICVYMLIFVYIRLCESFTKVSKRYSSIHSYITLVEDLEIFKGAG